MEIDGYRIEKDESFTLGEQYFVYKSTDKGRDLVGWILMSFGILRVAPNYPPHHFIFHRSFGETAEDHFLSLKDYREAMRVAIRALEDFYGDHPDPKKNILAVLGPVEELPASQIPLL